MYDSLLLALEVANKDGCGTYLDDAQERPAPIQLHKLQVLQAHSSNLLPD